MTIMRRFVLMICCVCCSLISISQQPVKGSVKLHIVNAQQAALENATVELLRVKDSSLAKVAITDKDGSALFENIPSGDYIARITNVNFITHYTSLIQLTGTSISVPVITLLPKSGDLSAVTVTARKPFIQRLTDRIVVNVENSIVSAGSSAMEVLERSPGVNIDQNDVISLRGKSGVIIMIDGKPTAMSGADLANYLRGLPSAAIERIEIITNPSAKYDAAGNSGIIDIRMKKDQRLGINGTLTAGYGQGVYPKANAGGTFNYRNKDINVFGNYNYAYRVGLNHLILDRNFFSNGAYSGGDLKDNYAKMPFSSHTTRIGMDYFPSKKTIIGFVVNGNFNHFTRRNNNRSTVINPQKQATSKFSSLATNNDHGKNAVANINFKHTFDSTGREITADVDYGEYRSNSLTHNATSYYNLDNSSLYPDYILDGDQEGKLTFKTGKVDYVNPLKKGARFEAGFKTSFVSADNDAKFFDVSSGTPQNDVNKTNHFLYHENNNAGYINFRKEWSKFDIQLGLRGENTRIETEQLKGNIKFDSSYFQLFPSAFFNYKMGEEKTLGISVSRRIDRPGYSQLNPFLFLIDVTTYATGRPGLLPQKTWSYEMSYTVKSLSVSLNYSHTIDPMDIAIAKFRDIFPNIPSEDNVTVQIPINLSSSDYYGLSISAPIKITKWWNMINNGDIYYQHFNGALGTTGLKRGKPSLDLRTNNTFSFKKGWTAELNGSFSSAGQAGFMVFDPRWGIGAGAQKTVMKGKGTVRFNMTDIFWTNLPKAVITYDNYIEKWRAFRETRVANLTFTYRFGNNKVQAARRRTTASEEERQRAGN
jgi:iron complex outermembrane recepter protein